MQDLNLSAKNHLQKQSEIKQAQNGRTQKLPFWVLKIKDKFANFIYMNIEIYRKLKLLDFK